MKKWIVLVLLLCATTFMLFGCGDEYDGDEYDIDQMIDDIDAILND